MPGIRHLCGHRLSKFREPLDDQLVQRNSPCNLQKLEQLINAPLIGNLREAFAFVDLWTDLIRYDFAGTGGGIIAHCDVVLQLRLTICDVRRKVEPLLSQPRLQCLHIIPFNGSLPRHPSPLPRLQNFERFVHQWRNCFSNSFQATLLSSACKAHDGGSGKHSSQAGSLARDPQGVARAWPWPLPAAHTLAVARACLLSYIITY